MTETDERVLARTRRWVEKVVIGLNLCPFAKAVQTRGQVRYALSHAENEAELLRDLARELDLLRERGADEIDTTLLVHPRVLQGFFDYNDFLAVADELLVERGLDGELQIASFHPDYCFADAKSDDPANYTNRSPYPMLHLLREASVTRAVDDFPDTARIYERNVRLLRELAPASLRALLQDDRSPSDGEPSSSASAPADASLEEKS